MGRIRRNDFVLKLSVDRYGYWRKNLRVSGNPRRPKYVHALVLLAFVGPKPEGYTINHKDGNKSNNQVENLEYITREDNLRHGHKQGLYRASGGHRINKPLAEQILKFREDMSYREIRDKTGVSFKTLRDICRRESAN